MVSLSDFGKCTAAALSLLGPDSQVASGASESLNNWKAPSVCASGSHLGFQEENWRAGLTGDVNSLDGETHHDNSDAGNLFGGVWVPSAPPSGDISDADAISQYRLGQAVSCIPDALFGSSDEKRSGIFGSGGDIGNVPYHSGSYTPSMIAEHIEQVRKVYPDLANTLDVQDPPLGG